MVFFLGLGLSDLLLASVIFTAFYCWYKSNFNHYWKRKGVPSDAPGLLFGALADLLTGKPPFALDEEQYKKHGRICGLYFRRIPMLLVAEPELVKLILIKDFLKFPQRREALQSKDILSNMMPLQNGDNWKRLRNILTPMFTTGKLRKLTNMMNKSCEKIAECLLNFADSNTTVDLKRQFDGFTLDVIASTAFGIDLDSIRNPDNVYPINARKILNVNFNWRLILLTLAPKLMKTMGIGVLNTELKSFFSELVMKILEQRRNGGKVREDFLQMLIDIESEATADKKEILDEESENLSSQHNYRKTLTRDELVAQCVLFFLSGYDTTATFISHVCYRLALNDNCQDRLLKEVDQTWEMNGGMMDYNAVSNMKYLEAVFAETLRLNPSSSRLQRLCVEDYLLGDTGITIPKGMFVGIPIYSMHRDPNFFPDPERFDPDRFLPENKSSIKPYTYLPFGSGPRKCVGMRFALMAAKHCLVHVLRHVSFHKCPETNIPLEYYSESFTGIIHPKAIHVRVQRRR